MAIAPPRTDAADEEAMILDVVRQLVKERVEPRAAEIDAQGEFAWDIKQLFAENDLFGIPFPAEYGGLGGSFVTYVKVVEEVSKACASSALIIAVQELGALPIMIAGSDEQKRRWLPELASGETARRLRADRARFRLRRRRLDAHQGRARRRRLRARRHARSGSPTAASPT